MVTAMLFQNDYKSAMEILETIVNNDKLGFNDKNTAEELIAFTKHKLRI